VTIEGGRQRLGSALDLEPAVPPEPNLEKTARPFNILITGVGGTGVVTLGALIGMAAHLDGKGVSVLDMTGIAQKGGAVFSHVRLCDDPAAIHAPRIATGEADAILGGDAIVSASPEALSKMRAGRTRAAINAAATPTAEFTADPDWRFPLDAIEAALATTIGGAAFDALDATTLATRLMGNAIYANILLLGFAWQRGLVPLSEAALLRAIELNGADVALNRRAFRWGRAAAHDPAGIAALLPSRAVSSAPKLLAPLARKPGSLPPTGGASAGDGPASTLDELLADRVRRLTDYQDAALAGRYRARVEQIRSHPAANEALAARVACNYYKLLAVKDEYEVARLYAETDFLDRIAAQFEGDYRLDFHLAPPLLARPDPNTGVIVKRRYGPWMMMVFRWLARMRKLRGTRWDIFARSPERRLARQLLAEYEDDLDLILARLDASRLPAALELSGWPEQVRGFGHVREKSALAARHQREGARAKLAG
jgi:indolepyruvate ferredoxin oxidoreductase